MLRFRFFPHCHYSDLGKKSPSQLNSPIATKIKGREGQTNNGLLRTFQGMLYLMHQTDHFTLFNASPFETITYSTIQHDHCVLVCHLNPFWQENLNGHMQSFSETSSTCCFIIARAVALPTAKHIQPLRQERNANGSNFRYLVEKNGYCLQLYLILTKSA